MSHIEITDAMVERLEKALINRWGAREGLRAALDAALNPPTVPREVTEAGLDEWWRGLKMGGHCGEKAHSDMSRAFLAMLEVHEKMKADERAARSAGNGFGVDC